MSQRSGSTVLLLYIYIFFIQVSSWSSWGSCSAPPGRCSTNSGTKKRTRRVTLSPSCGGSSCPTLTDTSQCTPVPIPCKVFLLIFFPVFSNLLLVCQVFFIHLSFFKMDCHLQNHHQGALATTTGHQNLLK